VSLVDVLVASADRHGARPALTDLATGKTLTYADVLAEAERLAATLRREGVGPGQRVALVAENGLAHVPSAFGILAAGACLVPVAATLRPAEVAAVLDETDVNAVVRLAGEEPTFAWIDRDRPAVAGFDALDAAFVRFTSGTTADRKGVILSHADVLARVEAADAVLGLGPDDRVLWTLPLAYHFAVTITAYARAGAHVLLCRDTLPRALVDAAERARATLLYGSPLQFERMAHAGKRGALDAVRVALSTAAALPPGVASEFEAAFGVPLGQAYGIIEAGLPCINTRADGVEASSVGPAVPGYAVAVVGDDRAPCPAGVAGEVVVRGAGLFSGYYRPWRPRADVLRDGWLDTGDVGVLDARGCLTLRGRTKSTIVTAGMKTFPEEVEAVLDGLPGVRESRVVGLPHPRLGEVPCAEIVCEAGATLDARALGAACAERLSSHKVPVEFRAVTAVPRTPGGKIRRT
jgi:acyl-CoA synthetase (AMP-forming)/AMP-acid ligase II